MSGTIYDAEYRIALMWEQLSIFWILLQVKLGLRTLSIEERYRLKEKKEWLHTRVRELKL